MIKTRQFAFSFLFSDFMRLLYMEKQMYLFKFGFGIINPEQNFEMIDIFLHSKYLP